MNAAQSFREDAERRGIVAALASSWWTIAKDHARNMLAARMAADVAVHPGIRRSVESSLKRSEAYHREQSVAALAAALDFRDRAANVARVLGEPVRIGDAPKPERIGNANIYAPPTCGIVTDVDASGEIRFACAYGRRKLTRDIGVRGLGWLRIEAREVRRGRTIVASLTTRVPGSTKRLRVPEWRTEPGLDGAAACRLLDTIARWEACAVEIAEQGGEVEHA